MANNSSEHPLNKSPFEVITRKIKIIDAKYKECKRNHGTQLGTNILDGCGEFVLKGTSETRDVDMYCEACGCHRNFHHKELKKKMSVVYFEDEEASLRHLHWQLSL
ncbi:hypothetical protein PTKIN_Ptkin06aG0173900 [Pterospermum kingtungense]